MTRHLMPQINSTMGTTLNIWRNIYLESCRPDVATSACARFTEIPLHWLRLNRAQLEFFLHLQNEWSKKSDLYDYLFFLLMLKGLPVPANGNGSQEEVSSQAA